MKAARVAAAAATGLLLASCTSGPAPAPGPLRDELRIAVRRPSILDPAALRDAAGVLIAGQVFEPLLGFDPGTLQLEPRLAESWEVHDGATRFTFRLRAGATFHGGEAVTPEDVRFSWNRLARKQTASELAFLLEPVAGFDAVRRGAAGELEGVRALDEHTIEVRLSFPWADFPYVLTHPATAALSRERLETDGDGFAAQPAGSGPYELAAPLEEGRDILLRRFPGYHGGAPAVARVRFLVYEQPAAAWRDLEAGLVDIAEVPPGAISSAATRYGGAGFSPAAAGVYLGLNLASPGLQDRRLRQAVSLAVDREGIARAVYDEAVVPATGIVPVGLLGRNELACGAMCRREPARARDLLGEAFGDAGPPRVAYDYPSGAPEEAVARTLQANLADVGIELELRPRDLPGFLAEMKAGRTEMFRLGWAAEYPLADWFLAPLFAAGSSDNQTGYADADVDELIGRARAEPDRDARLRLYREIEARVLRDMPVVPLGFFRNHLVALDRVQGFYADPLGTFQVARFRL